MAEEPNKQADVKPEPDKKEPTVTKHKYTVGGQEIELEPSHIQDALNRANDMATYLRHLQQEGIIDDKGNIIKPKVEEKEPEKELEPDDKIKVLEEKINKLEAKTEVDKAVGNLNKQLSVIGNNFDLTKDDKDMRNLVETVVLSEFYMNPAADVTALYRKAIDHFQKAVDKKHTELIKRKATDSKDKGDGPGGSISLKLDKPFSKDDLKLGAVKRAVMDRLKEIG